MWSHNIVGTELYMLDHLHSVSASRSSEDNPVMMADRSRMLRRPKRLTVKQRKRKLRALVRTLKK